jgi:hypothetical protein
MSLSTRLPPTTCAPSRDTSCSTHREHSAVTSTSPGKPSSTATATRNLAQSVPPPRLSTEQIPLSRRGQGEQKSIARTRVKAATGKVRYGIYKFICTVLRIPVATLYLPVPTSVGPASRSSAGKNTGTCALSSIHHSIVNTVERSTHTTNPMMTSVLNYQYHAHTSVESGWNEVGSKSI